MMLNLELKSDFRHRSKGINNTNCINSSNFNLHKL